MQKKTKLLKKTTRNNKQFGWIKMTSQKMPCWHVLNTLTVPSKTGQRMLPTTQHLTCMQIHRTTFSQTVNKVCLWHVAWVIFCQVQCQGNSCMVSGQFLWQSRYYLLTIILLVITLSGLVALMSNNLTVAVFCYHDDSVPVWTLSISSFQTSFRTSQLEAAAVGWVDGGSGPPRLSRPSHSFNIFLN